MVGWQQAYDATSPDKLNSWQSTLANITSSFFSLNRIIFNKTPFSNFKTLFLFLFLPTDSSPCILTPSAPQHASSKKFCICLCSRHTKVIQDSLPNQLLDVTNEEVPKTQHTHRNLKNKNSLKRNVVICYTKITEQKRSTKCKAVPLTHYHKSTHSDTLINSWSWWHRQFKFDSRVIQYTITLAYQYNTTQCNI